MPQDSVMYVAACVQEMAAADVAALIGPAQYAAIKQRDPHPFFAVVTVAHEGVSRGRILGAGARAKLWTAERIRELANALTPPTSRTPVPVYIGHDAHNAPRHAFGAVIGSLVRSIRGTLHALGILHITDPHTVERIRSGALDACSIEATLEFEPPATQSEPWRVHRVAEVTGLALGNAQTSPPGFAGAGVVSTVQEFDAAEAPPVQTQTASPADAPTVHALVRAELERANLSDTERALCESSLVGEFTGMMPVGADEPLTVRVQRRVHERLGEWDRLKTMYRDAAVLSAPLPSPPRAQEARAPARSLDYTDPHVNELIPG